MNKNYKRNLQKLRHQRYVQRKARKKSKYSFLKKHSYARHRQRFCSKNNNQKQFRQYSSKVLTCLDTYGFKIHIPQPENNMVYLDVPQIMCLSKSPDESIFFLRKLYTYLMDIRIKKVHFNHFSCEYLGVCASTIMDIIIIECTKYRNSINNKIEISGSLRDNKVSGNNDVDALLKMSGLLKHLNIFKGKVPNTEQLELITNGDSSTVAEKTIEYVDHSLSRHNVELTKAGKNLFASFLGEIVNNCEVHGGTNVVWYTLGHYSYDPKSELGKCKLCIIDFGETIYEGLKNCKSQKVLKRINHYNKKAWYSFKSVNNKETLYTLFSLQQRVSRIIDKDIVRGNGTITFIESILQLFNTEDDNYKSIFSITSGKCSILFDGKYKLEEKSYKTGYKNKIIAFNDTNDLYKEPDENYVRAIKNGFPGTVISMDLYIDNKYIQRSK